MGRVKTRGWIRRGRASGRVHRHGYGERRLPQRTSRTATAVCCSQTCLFPTDLAVRCNGERSVASAWRFGNVRVTTRTPGGRRANAYTLRSLRARSTDGRQWAPVAAADTRGSVHEGVPFVSNHSSAARVLIVATRDGRPLASVGRPMCTGVVSSALACLPPGVLAVTRILPQRSEGRTNHGREGVAALQQAGRISEPGDAALSFLSVVCAVRRQSSALRARS